MQIVDEIARELNKKQKSAIGKALFNTGLVLGTVTGPNKVKLDNFKYEVTCLFLEYVTRKHKRIVTISHDEMTERDLGDKTEYDYLDTDDKAPPYTSYKHSFVELKFEDVLKAGDRVLVAVVNNGSDHVVLGRVAE
jgi:hypothetical protein